MRSKTTQQADKILTAAAELFATHRFHEARMEDVAALATVGKGTLYRYFQDKDELYVALLRRASEGLEARLRALPGGGGPREDLEQVVRALIGYFDENPHLFDLIQHAEAVRKPDQEFPWQQTRDLTLARVGEALARASREGQFHIADGEVAVLMLLGGLRGVIRFGPRPRPEGLARRVVEGFLAGFAAPAPGRGGAGGVGKVDNPLPGTA